MRKAEDKTEVRSALIRVMITYITENRESFAGLNFHGFLEEHKSFPRVSFALSTMYKHPGLAPQKYYQENPYSVYTVKV